MSDETASPLDRELQRLLLETLQTHFPASRFLPAHFPEVDETKLIANLLYMEEHGLCSSGVRRGMNNFAMGPSVITARGLDFLANDGGLSAILGVVTVRMHADTIRDLIAAKIDASAVAPEERRALRKHLNALSETALRSATTDLVRSGLDHLPDAIHWLRTVAGL